MHVASLQQEALLNRIDMVKTALSVHSAIPWGTFFAPTVESISNGHVLWQDDERDSSDEEWDIAYAAMDPIAQLGWGNQGPGVEGPATHIVRDVLAAADVVHEDAMSEYGENNNRGGQYGGSLAVGTNDSASQHTECSPDAECSVDYDPQGYCSMLASNLCSSIM